MRGADGQPVVGTHAVPVTGSVGELKRSPPAPPRSTLTHTTGLRPMSVLWLIVDLLMRLPLISTYTTTGMGAKNGMGFVVLVTLGTMLALHLVSHATLSRSGDGTWAGFLGMDGGSAPSGDTAAISALLQRRETLVSEIAQLKHVISGLEKVRRCFGFGLSV